MVFGWYLRQVKTDVQSSDINHENEEKDDEDDDHDSFKNVAISQQEHNSISIDVRSAADSHEGVYESSVELSVECSSSQSGSEAAETSTLTKKVLDQVRN